MATGLVDAITMEDISKFPDANLARALMRIPGVTTSFTSNATNNGQSTTTGLGTSVQRDLHRPQLHGQRAL